MLEGPNFPSLQELDELLEDLDVTLQGRKFPTLQELDELLEESLRSSSHSPEKRNESEFASGLQDLVEPLPQITVAILGQPCLWTQNSYLDDPLDNFIHALLDLVVKFRTKLHIAFPTPDQSAKLLQTAILRDCVGLAKLVVAMEPLRISNNRCLCPATVMAKVMKCASTIEVVTLLFEICRDPPFDHANLLQTSFHDLPLWHCGMEYRYTAFFLKHIEPSHISGDSSAAYPTIARIKCMTP
jgi:hypothetical protein